MAITFGCVALSYLFEPCVFTCRLRLRFVKRCKSMSRHGKRRHPPSFYAAALACETTCQSSWGTAGVSTVGTWRCRRARHGRQRVARQAQTRAAISQRQGTVRANSPDRRQPGELHLYRCLQLGESERKDVGRSVDGAPVRGDRAVDVRSSGAQAARECDSSIQAITTDEESPISLCRRNAA